MSYILSSIDHGYSTVDGTYSTRDAAMQAASARFAAATGQRATPIQETPRKWVWAGCGYRVTVTRYY